MRCCQIILELLKKAANQPRGPAWCHHRPQTLAAGRQQSKSRRSEEFLSRVQTETQEVQINPTARKRDAFIHPYADVTSCRVSVSLSSRRANEWRRGGGGGGRKQTWKERVDFNQPPFFCLFADVVERKKKKTSWHRKVQRNQRGRDGERNAAGPRRDKKKRLMFKKY